MPARKTLLLVVDGLSIRDLGVFGNTWIPTPSIDRISVGALVFEQAIARSTQPADFLATLLERKSPDDEQGSLLAAIQKKGISTVLVSDTTAPFGERFSAESFDRFQHVQPSPRLAPADDWEQTHCAQFFAELLRTSSELPDDSFLCAYYGGLTSCWDAPLAWRTRFADEGDESPLAGTEPASGRWTKRDADELVRLYQAMAAEVMVFDACLGPFWDELRNDSDLRMILVAPRGYPLGEHGRVGWSSPVLYSEGIAVPLIVADSQNDVGWRSQQLVSPEIVGEWLHESYSNDQGLDFDELAQRFVAPTDRTLVVTGPNERGVRTKEWYLIKSTEKAELYVKPDDRWEFNDVSSRCPAVVEELEGMLTGDDCPNDETPTRT